MEAELGVAIKQTRGSVKLPRYETEGSAALDVATSEKATFYPGEFHKVPTGLVLKVPSDMLLLVLPRSSTFDRYKLIMPHSMGVIDSDFCGPEDLLQLLFVYMGEERMEIPAGTRLAQMVLVPKIRAEIVPHKTVGVENRGGVGSTGK